MTLCGNKNTDLFRVISGPFMINTTINDVTKEIARGPIVIFHNVVLNDSENIRIIILEDGNGTHGPSPFLRR